MKEAATNKEPTKSFHAIIGKDLYNFSLEPLIFPPNTPIIKKPEIHLNVRYILQNQEPPLPLILSYQNVNRFFYKAQFTASSAQVYSHNSDHICVLDHDLMRCKICGISLKWCYMADKFQMKPTNLAYNENSQIEPDFILFKDLRSLATIRKYISYIMERPMGVGFEDLYLKNFKYPIEVFNELGGVERIQSQSNELFKVISDYENSNLQGFKILKDGKDSFTIRLLMRGDTNSMINGFTQWFFFKIIAKKPISLTLEIINFRKSMPDLETYKTNTLTYYDSDPEGANKVWKFMEETVKYTKNQQFLQLHNSLNGEKITEKEQECYTLKFNYTFDAAKEVLFSFTYPYTYSNLMDFLSKQEKKLFVKGIKEQEFDYNTKGILLENEAVSYNRIVLCPTVCGLPLFLLRITSSKYQDPDLYFSAKYKQKKYIIIIARQHPGEPPSSFLVESIIAFLLSDDQSAKILRTFFVFIIMPMMNPDGVILGNNRTGYRGTDFNRSWKSPNKETEPEVAYFKEYVENLVKEEKKIAMFFDLHGHSHKKGVFIYSTPPAFLKDWEVNDDSMIEWAKSLLFTNIMNNSCRYLCFENCKSILGKGKDESARIVMCKDLEIQYTYTIETSFACYSDKKDNELKRFKIEDFKILAKDLMMAILEFNITLADIEYTKNLKIKTEVSETFFNKYLSKMKKSYPEFKESWKDYFSEVQLQKLTIKLGKFIDLANENLFPSEKESPGKGIDGPPGATEQNLKDFYESYLFDRGIEPEIISNSSSFVTVKENKEGDEQNIEEIEKQENRKILGMMLFHEKDLKKTEKLLKKKAVKKVMMEKQNSANPHFTNTQKTKRVTMIGGGLMNQNSRKTQIFDNKNSQKLMETDKKEEHSQEKENPKKNENEKVIELFVKKDKEGIFANENKQFYTKESFILKSKTQVSAKEKESFFEKEKESFLGKEQKSFVEKKKALFSLKDQEQIFNDQDSFSKNKDFSGKNKEQITTKYPEHFSQQQTEQNEPLFLKHSEKNIRIREYLSANSKEYLPSEEKTYNSPAKERFYTSPEEKSRFPLKNSIQISTGLTYNTTSSTPHGQTAHSRFASPSENMKIQEFFEENEPQMVNEMLNSQDLSNIKDSSKKEIKARKDLRTGSDKRGMKTMDTNQIDIPEENIDCKNKMKSWTIKKRPKTTINLTKSGIDQAKYNYDDPYNQFEESASHHRDFSEDLNQTNGFNIERGHYKELSGYYMGYSKNMPMKIYPQNTSERFCKSKSSKRKLVLNPFLKSKKDIYELYTFKKPVILVRNRVMGMSKRNETSPRSEEIMKKKMNSFMTEEKQKRGEPNGKYEAFHILRKNFL